MMQEQLAFIIEQLSPPFADFDAEVHSARKSFKKVRALLLLIESGLGEKLTRKENRFYRDMARQLASARERFVALSQLNALIDAYPQQLNSEGYAPMRALLQSDYEQAARALQNPEMLAGLVSQLQAAQARVDKWTFQRPSFEHTLAQGLEAAYRNGVEGFRTAQADPTPDNLHEWRKSVKHLWYHLRILSPIWEPMLLQYTDTLDTLAELLGDDHDYAELKVLLFSLPDDLIALADIVALMRTIDTERERLQAEAWQIAQRLYAEKPSAFVRRHAQYWQVWQQTDTTV